MRHTKPIEITFKNGNKKYYSSISQAGKDLNLPATVISALLTGYKSIVNVRELDKQEIEARSFKRF